MINKILDFFYINNYFKSAIYFLKVLSIFNNRYKRKIIFFRYFKKRKKNYKKKILKNLYQSKIFIFNFPYNTEKIINHIYNYDQLNRDNQYSNHGHSNVYQSEHNLEKKKEFSKISYDLEFFINKKLNKFFDFQVLKINKLWFVITKNLGIIKKHSHFDSDFSGVFYLKVEENRNDDAGLKIHNFSENIEVYKFHNLENKFIKTICNDKTLLLKPKKNDLIIFNSYIEHSVYNKSLKDIDRISLPFDLIF